MSFVRFADIFVDVLGSRRDLKSIFERWGHVNVFLSCTLRADWQTEKTCGSCIDCQSLKAAKMKSTNSSWHEHKFIQWKSFARRLFSVADTWSTPSFLSLSLRCWCWGRAVFLEKKTFSMNTKSRCCFSNLINIVHMVVAVGALTRAHWLAAWLIFDSLALLTTAAGLVDATVISVDVILNSQASSGKTKCNNGNHTVYGLLFDDVGNESSPLATHCTPPEMMTIKWIEHRYFGISSRIS